MRVAVAVYRIVPLSQFGITFPSTARCGLRSGRASSSPFPALPSSSIESILNPPEKSLSLTPPPPPPPLPLPSVAKLWLAPDVRNSISATALAQRVPLRTRASARRYRAHRAPPQDVQARAHARGRDSLGDGLPAPASTNSKRKMNHALRRLRSVSCRSDPSTSHSQSSRGEPSTFHSRAEPSTTTTSSASSRSTYTPMPRKLTTSAPRARSPRLTPMRRVLTALASCKWDVDRVLASERHKPGNLHRPPAQRVRVPRVRRVKRVKRAGEGGKAAVRDTES
ncbi:hypothetical protein C8R44DRAFT_991323 [Mycena epipterygia]|nr:hypothetical protein C8R44DRAFT_991323 [Mycena epipterygia]